MKIERERVSQNGQHVELAFRFIIVGRDSMSSGLLAEALVRDLGCEAVAIRSSGLLQTLATRHADLVAISADLNGQLGLGFDLAKAVTCAHPKIPVVVLLDQPSQKAVIKAFRCGARGVFCRQQPISEFLDCVEHVRKGFLWAAGEEASFLLTALKSMPAPIELTEGNASILTTREAQVVRQAATGKTNKAIASELGLSEHTVKNYLFHAFEKLGVSSRVELLFFLTKGGHSFDPLGSEQPTAIELAVVDGETTD